MSKKEDMREYSKKYYEENKDNLREKHKQYREENRDKMREYHKNYHEQNKDKRREYHKNYLEQNRDKIKERNKNYREQNKDKIKEYNKKYNKKYYATEDGKKSNTISSWISQGMVCTDWKAIHALYMITDKCDYCNCELVEGLGKNARCLDHDHESGEIRGILCKSCNIRDVFAST